MKIALTIYSLLFVSTITAQINDADAFYDGSYSNSFIRTQRIKSITVDVYVSNSKTSSSNFYFNKDGILKKATIIDSGGNKVNDYFFQFNKHGGLFAIKNFNYEIKKLHTVFYTKVYKGDKIIIDSSTDLPIKNEYIYNKKGQRVQTNIIGNSGYPIQNKRIIKYIYDSSGKLFEVSEKFYSGINDTLGYLISHTFITYKNSKVIREEEKILIDSDTPWNKGSIEYDYDNSGNLISIKSKKVASHFYNYDYRGLLLIKKTIMPEDFNNIISIDKYKYSFFK